MKKILIIFTCMFIMFSLASCSSLGDINQRILAPIAKVTPLEGKWKIIKVLNDENKKFKTSDNWVGKEAEFSNKVVIVGNYILYNPNFKMRRLSTEEYLLSSHKEFSGKINIPSGLAEVITITGKDKFLGEALKINEKQIILEFYNYNLLLIKISNSTDDIISKKIDIAGKTALDGDKQDDFIRTGVLIGLRAPITQTNKSELTQYKYRTLWIASKNRSLHPILETKNIFFPRKSGFWEIGVNNIKKAGIPNDSIFAYNVSMGVKNNSLDSNKTNVLIKKLNNVDSNNILNYVGNDYVSIENNKKEAVGIISKLNIMPIDSLPNLKATKIGDITSIEGINTLNINFQNLINSNLSKNAKIYDEKNIDNSFGLIRKAGHWYFEGRVNLLNNNKMFFEDYRINIIPPSNLIFYDELSLTWADIKEKVPDAVDAYTSPNKDIAIILAKKNKLIIYEINNGMLGAVPLKQIKLQLNEKIIMAEWATGSYVENWEKAFMGLI